MVLFLCPLEIARLVGSELRYIQRNIVAEFCLVVILLAQQAVFVCIFLPK